jgi:hypothetical protein
MQQRISRKAKYKNLQISTKQTKDLQQENNNIKNSQNKN